MLYTLSQAREKLKRFVDGGSCNNTVIDEMINDALERLMESESWDCLEVMTRIATCNACFPLPYNAARVTACTIDGAPSKVFSRMYQFLHSGPGDLDYRGSASAFQDLVDMGDHWPTMFDIPHTYSNTVDGEGETEVEVPDGLKLVAFCQDVADVGSALTVYGYKTGSEIVRNGAVEGEAINVIQWPGGVEGAINTGLVGQLWVDVAPLSTNAFTDITRIIKAETRGYVSLYAVDPDTNRMFFLAKYHPRQTIPQFRRYRITNKVSDVSTTSVLALLKLRYVPLVADDDILPIDSLQALKLMVMAISEENKANLQVAVGMASMASAVLAKKEESRTTSKGTPVILDSDYRTSLGAKLSRRIIL